MGSKIQSTEPSEELSISPSIQLSSEPTLRNVCVNVKNFNCAKIKKPKLKRGRNCSKIRNGVPIRELCPEVCTRFLCTCSDSPFLFKVKGMKGSFTCAKLKGRERRKLCKKRNDSGFPVKIICPIKCKNKKNCLIK